MAILVTGGMGVIGCWVTRALVEREERPVVYARHLDPIFISDILPEVEIVLGDLLDFPKILRTIKGQRIDRIIHMAAHVGAQENFYQGYKTNVEGTMNLFEAARLEGIKRVVNVTTMGVYGLVWGDHAHPTYKPINEDHPKNPLNVYDATKVFTENMAVNYNREYGMDILSIRFSATWGPGKLLKHRETIPFVIQSRMIERAMLGKEVVISRGGEQKADMAYHRDLAQGVVKACDVERTEHKIFHLGSGKAETLVDFAGAIREVLPKAHFDIGPGLDYWGVDRYYIYDLSRARLELGYEPRYDLRAGVRDYIEFMEKMNIPPLGGESDFGYTK